MILDCFHPSWQYKLHSSVNIISINSHSTLESNHCLPDIFSMLTWSCNVFSIHPGKTNTNHLWILQWLTIIEFWNSISYLTLYITSSCYHPWYCFISQLTSEFYHLASYCIWYYLKIFLDKIPDYNCMPTLYMATINNFTEFLVLGFD